MYLFILYERTKLLC